MRRSGLFAPVRRSRTALTEASSAEYLVEMGYIAQVGAGLLTHLPLGLAAFNNLRSVLNRHLEELANCSFQEFPALHPRAIWEKGGRLEKFGRGIFQLHDQHDRPMVLAPTHEVTAAELAAEFVRSYKELPIRISQIQIKYRDEARPRGGVIRTRQFTMHDLYSFDTDEAAARIGYDLVKEAYLRTFADIRLPVLAVEQRDTGAIGGDLSHEFQVPARIGDDRVIDPGGTEHPSLEVAHIFMLGTSYSEAAGARYVDAESKSRLVYMCSFGMGIERTVAAYIETYLAPRTRTGEMIWCWALAPFQIMILGTRPEAFETYRMLKGKGYRVLIDDRDIPFRQSMAEGLALGFPIYVVFGERSGPNQAELICRRTGFDEIVDLGALAPPLGEVTQDLEAVELAECWGRVIDLDRGRRSIVVGFREPWMMTAGAFQQMAPGRDLLGRFDESKKGTTEQRLLAGPYWVIPVVAGDVTEPVCQLAGDIRYVVVPNNESPDAELIRSIYHYQ